MHLFISLSFPSVLTFFLVESCTDGLDVWLHLDLELVRALLRVLRVTLGVVHQVALGHAGVHAHHVGLRHADLLVLCVTLFCLHFFVISVIRCSIF